MLINDDEFDTEYPEVLDDERLVVEDAQSPAPPTLLLANIHIARLMSPLAKAFRTLCITNEALNRFENYLGDCLNLFPRILQLSSSIPLDACIMAPIVHFQNVRILLHRHNLSPSCSPEQRLQAIEQCTHAARDTATLLSRCMIPHMNAHEWEQRFVLSTTTILCTHLWRCMLFLIFRQQYDACYIVLRAAMTIGEARSINISCGRYLASFTRRLIERYEQSPNLDVEQDEDLLVFLSADLQATTNSWVWGNAETGTHLSRRQKHGRPRHTSIEQDSQPQNERYSPSWAGMLTEEEQHDWGGWQNVERSVRYLQQLTESRVNVANHVQPNTTTTSQTTGPILAPINTSQQTHDVNRSRMTIANII